MDNKTSFCLEDFKTINQKFSSELFVSIMVLLQNNIQCSTNFFRYFKKYRSMKSNEINGLDIVSS